MAKIYKKGQRGAARAYVTRSTALKKLQCTLADFRRLCILKGIFPRVPRHKKRANKGNSISTTFYYAKDIAYLAHEPVLRKLREHKAFAKRLSRALGRGEWSSAKSLDDNKPLYNLDHIIKERYPSFVDAIRDIDDALCLISLFASLASTSRLPASITHACARLSAEWQLYIIHSRALRKAFLSVKGVYYQAEVTGQTITWLVPFQFTQSIPSEVDIRIMLTFLELYQTLLRFVLFKLYMDLGLVYPPSIDFSKDDAASGIDAYRLDDQFTTSHKQSNDTSRANSDVRHIKSREVKNRIRELDGASSIDEDPLLTRVATPRAECEKAPSSLSPLPPGGDLLSPCTFYLSRGSPRALLEFVIRSFGGRVGWPSSMGSGSLIQEDDPSITHVIIDHPSLPSSTTRLSRKYVQPQWVIDSINARQILPEAFYSQGSTLPPHRSPFEDMGHIIAVNGRISPLGLDQAGVDASIGTSSSLSNTADHPQEAQRPSTTSLSDMNKMLLSNKQRKLYERIRFGERKLHAENQTRENKKISLREKVRELRRNIQGGSVEP